MLRNDNTRGLIFKKYCWILDNNTSVIMIQLSTMLMQHTGSEFHIEVSICGTFLGNPCFQHKESRKSILLLHFSQFFYFTASQRKEGSQGQPLGSYDFRK